MPITSSAVKAARQSLVRRDRRQPFKTHMKTSISRFMELIKEGKKADAAQMLSTVYKSIDTATKKHIIHRNTASRKKSLLARLIK